MKVSVAPFGGNGINPTSILHPEPQIPPFLCPPTWIQATTTDKVWCVVRVDKVPRLLPDASNRFDESLSPLRHNPLQVKVCPSPAYSISGSLTSPSLSAGPAVEVPGLSRFKQSLKRKPPLFSLHPQVLLPVPKSSPADHSVNAPAVVCINTTVPAGSRSRFIRGTRFPSHSWLSTLAHNPSTLTFLPRHLSTKTMLEVTGYPQQQYFGGPAHRVFPPSPPAVPLSSSTPELLREVAFNASNYYSSSNPATKQQAETRSASVSSVSSSTSLSSPPSMQHGTSSRTISPVHSMTDSAIGNALVAGTHYQQSPQPQSYTPQAHTTLSLPSPSQYFQAHMAPPATLYSSLSQRQYSQSQHYGYQVGSIPSHPSPLSMQSFPGLDFTHFATSSYHSPSSALQSYQTSPLLQYRPEVRGPSPFLKGLQSLPPHIISQIHRSFTYLECFQVSKVSRWFKEKFDPANLPVEDKIAGVRYAEQYYRRYFPGRASSSNASGSGREYDAKHPGSFGCYHCFQIKGPECFEQFKWNNHPEDDGNNETGSSASTPGPGAVSARSTPPKSSVSAYSSTGNPHYDPSLTRSSVTAAANNSRRASRAESTGSPISSSTAAGGSMPSTDSPRIKETWGIRRFCIDCGIRKQYYRPGDLIELCKTKEAVWVCQCWKIHWRPAEIKCTDCGSFIPLSTPSRRRGLNSQTIHCFPLSIPPFAL
ncbi:uncharacterized protein QC761_103370 [Podospora bellae-mahoneyi]|uniref:F-box domain-containing protein n=1 Tax=Podospora bellae-mahoneyi TaxID=2093777 RepID=A0ABR0FUT4_9PEZI|nr:hypothetical protein QC761_103370 [Podospora bellae-mahoneyi]